MFLLSRNVCLPYKTSESFFDDFFYVLFHGNKGGYKGLQVGYRGLQGVTRGYKGLQVVTRGYRGLQTIIKFFF